LRLTLVEYVSACFVEPSNSSIGSFDIVHIHFNIERFFGVHQTIANFKGSAKIRKSISII